MVVDIAIISKTKIVDNTVWDESTEADALIMAKHFMESGHFDFEDADDVQIMPEGTTYNVGDFYIDGQFVKAINYLVLDTNGIILDVETRPAQKDSLNEISMFNGAESVFFYPIEPYTTALMDDETPAQEKFLVRFNGASESHIGMRYKDGEIVPHNPTLERIAEQDAKIAKLMAIVEDIGINASETPLKIGKD